MTKLEPIGKVIDDYLTAFFEQQEGAIHFKNLHQFVLEEMERPLIAHALRLCGGNQTKAADMLGLHRNTIRKRIAALNISYE